MKKVLLPLLFLGCAAFATAQTTIKMRTTKDVGDSFTLLVDSGLECKMDWGDGVYEEFVSTLSPIEGITKGKNLTLQANGITLFDCSGQQINQLTFSGAATMETLIVSDNKLINLSLAGMTALKTLWCDNNTIMALNLSKQPNLESLVTSTNLLAKIDLPAEGFTRLTDCWIDHNRFKTFNLTGSTRLSTLNVESNQMESLTLPLLAQKAQAVFIDGNSLDFTSLWNRTSAINWYGTQQTVSFSQESYKINEPFSLDRNLYGTNQDGTDLTPASFIYSWYPYSFGVKGEKLKKGTAGQTDCDYTTPSSSEQKHVFTFLRDFDDVQLEIKNNRYASFLLVSNHLSIIDPTGLDDAKTDADGLQITIQNRAVSLMADQPTNVKVYNSAGQTVWTGTVQQPTRIPLTPGIYIVNNKKVNIR